MILLQILIVPGVALLLLGAIFVIGSAGVEQPGYSSWVDRDGSVTSDPDSTWTAYSIHLQRQSRSSNMTGLEQLSNIQSELMYSNPPHESLSELPLYKL